MKLAESQLRRIVRKMILSEEAFNLDREYEHGINGVHAFHGAGMSNTQLKFQSQRRPGPQFEKDGAVTAGEIKHALNYLNKHEPEELVVYSRGSAVWAAAQDEAGKDGNPDLPSSLEKIIYLAPAAKRPSWGQASNSVQKHGGDEVIASVSDGRVPVAQAANIAQELGGSLTLYKPAHMKKYLDQNGEVPEDATQYGKSGHTQPMHWKPGEGQKFSGGDLQKIIDSFPDWKGAPAASKEEIEDQESKAAEMMEIRRIIRNILLEKEVKCPRKNGKRDYKCEYQKYGGASKKGKKDRAARNQARKVAKREGRVKKGDGKEIDHKKPLSKGGSNAKSNQRVVSRATNRKKGNK
jgi:hypothetical protein